MLAKHENALLAALRARPGLRQVLRNIQSLPAVPSRDLLKRYTTEAPAVYVVAPKLIVRDDMAVIECTLPLMVRNVAGHAQARKGDGVDSGIDQLFTLVCRTIHGKRIGDASWVITSAEMADDDFFIEAGLTVMDVSIRSSEIELPREWDEDTADMSLDDLKHVHMDFDIAPHALGSDYGKWLQQPPDYTTAQPDAQADIQLAGGST